MEAVNKEPFQAGDDNVILIDPDIDIKEKFEAIDLACNKEQRINNQVNAVVRSREEIMELNKLREKAKAPVVKKEYDTDQEGEEEVKG